MSCKTVEKVFRTKITTRASNPHGLACAKARVRWHRLAETAYERRWDDAKQWRADFDCPDGCVKNGNGQIGDADPDPRCYPTNNGKRCTCIGYVSVRAWVSCVDAEHAAQIEEGEEAGEAEDE